MENAYRSLYSRLDPYLPQVDAWIDAYLARTASEATTIISKKFLRLPSYFSEETLRNAKVVTASPIQKPPLSRLGFREFVEFERMDAGAITYKNTFFIKPSLVGDESLHFHELVHVIQWRTAGANDFILAYAAGLAEFGYRNSPLEVMAYDLEDRFNAEEAIPDLEALVERQTEAVLANPLSRLPYHPNP